MTRHRATLVIIGLVVVLAIALAATQRRSAWLESYRAEPKPEGIDYWMQFGGRV